MATLVSELVRVLSDAAGRELRIRADGAVLSRAEILALATLNELACDYLSAEGELPLPKDDSDWATLQVIAEFDAAKIADSKQRRLGSA